MASEVDGFELQALDALRVAGVEMPGVVACDADPLGALMERVPGDGDSLALADPDRRRRLDHQFLAELVKVHEIDTSFSRSGHGRTHHPGGAPAAWRARGRGAALLLPIDQLR